MDAIDKGTPETDWDALVPHNFPFFRHTFLLGLEETRCISRATGWEPPLFIDMKNPC